ncbi:MAG: bifunctional oligoribonuclease/PAP phosphatase NrnA [Candidatus Omnitrophica bacterium]|nr:bifunctional oligoribonuclease/PAP phosphatase NrnA [Candidatus Omnitrophota bacterium]
MNKGLNAALKAIKSRNNFLITSHVNMEGDAVGSQLAMADILKKLGKRYIILDNDPVPSMFNFLLGAEKIRNRLGKNDKFDAIISVDCPIAERTGNVARHFRNAKVIINIDHHVSNSNFGDFVWVDPKMSSGGEMLYHIYKRLGLKIDRRAAVCMYVAISTDTGYFAYENTSPETHRIVSELLKTGIKPLWVANHLNEKKSMNDLRLLAETLGTLKLHYNGRVASMHTSRKMLKKLKVGPESVEGFVNYARSINTVDVAVYFLERPDKPGEVHVSFRSKGTVNVNRAASLFNGGGHPNASGCVVKGSIARAKKIILPQIKSFIKWTAS